MASTKRFHVTWPTCPAPHGLHRGGSRQSGILPGKLKGTESAVWLGADSHYLVNLVLESPSVLCQYDHCYQPGKSWRVGRETRYSLLWVLSKRNLGVNCVCHSPGCTIFGNEVIFDNLPWGNQSDDFVFYLQEYDDHNSAILSARCSVLWQPGWCHQYRERLIGATKWHRGPRNWWFDAWREFKR